MSDYSENRIGIDFGRGSFKIIKASGPVDKPVLSGVWMKDINGVPSQEISNSLKVLAEESHISGADVTISVSGPSVIMRFISLPKMDDNALKGAIKYEAEKYIPYNVRDCVIDFQTLRKDDKENKINILLVAAKRDYVQERVSVIEKAGFIVRVVDVDNFAIVNSFLAASKSVGPDKSFALLDIGAFHTSVSIVKDGSTYFARDIAIGGNDFTTAISRKAGVDLSVAEQMKLRPPKEKENDIAESIKGGLVDLFDEIKLSFGYYENQAGKGIDEVYVSGGGAGTAGIEQAFDEMLGVKPVFWDPFGFMEIPASGVDLSLVKKMKNYFAIAAGLVLR